MLIKITNKEIANALNVCEQYVSDIRKRGRISKKLVVPLIVFYESKIKELQEAIKVLDTNTKE